MKIVGIAGSVRRESWNKKLLAYAATVAEYAGQPLSIVDIGELPPYNSDIDGDASPDAVRKFREAIADADAFFFVTPEYNYSIPGVLKNAIDWGSTGKNLWGGKVAAVAGGTVGSFGTVASQKELRHVLTVLDVLVIGFPAVYIPKIQEAFAPDGKLTNEAAAKSLDAVLRKLIETTKKLRG